MMIGRSTAVVDRLEMLIKAFLRRLVVIGADNQRRIGARLLGLPGQLDRVLGRVRAGSGNDRDPLALGDLDAQADQPLLLVIGESRRFAGRAARHQSVGSLVDLPSHMLLKRAFVQLVVAKRRDQRDERSLEHRFLRDCGARSHDSPRGHRLQQRSKRRAVRGARSRVASTCSSARKAVRHFASSLIQHRSGRSCSPIFCGLLSVVFTRRCG